MLLFVWRMPVASWLWCPWFLSCVLHLLVLWTWLGSSWVVGFWHTIFWWGGNSSVVGCFPRSILMMSTSGTDSSESTPMYLFVLLSYVTRVCFVAFFSWNLGVWFSGHSISLISAATSSFKRFFPCWSSSMNFSFANWHVVVMFVLLVGGGLRVKCHLRWCHLPVCIVFVAHVIWISSLRSSHLLLWFPLR